MKANLQLKPRNNYYEILLAFHHGVPLTCDQLNFLRRYQSSLSNPKIDQVCRYYKVNESHSKSTRRKQGYTLFNPKALYEEIKQGLKNASYYELSMDHRKLLQFKTLLMNDLIFLHGNHTLTGAPFFAGGVPHVEFFQWGNLYGVVKYEEIPGETAVDANILIHFEEKQDLTHIQQINQERSLAQFADQYLKSHSNSLILRPRFFHEEPLTQLHLEERFSMRSQGA